MTPLPSPACGSLPCSPKKNLNQGSLLRGSFLTALLVLMLTTAADDFFAASRKLTSGTALELAAGASISATAPVWKERLPSQSGLSVATTKYAASKSVTTWQNKYQRRCMKMTGATPLLEWINGEQGCEL